MEYLIKTDSTIQRNRIRELLQPLGSVTDLWPDKSFNFRPYDEECTDKMVEILESQEIGSELI